MTFRNDHFVGVNAEALAALACPRCASPLEQADSLLCSRCGVSYSFIGRVPCLVREPSFWRARAAQQFDEYLAFTAGRLAELELELELRGSELLPRTRARLARIAGAMKVERELVAKVLAPLRMGALALPTPAALSATPLAGTLDLFTCYEHVFRDWAWGEAESGDALRITERLLSDARTGGTIERLAVFGAGAGRLAADIHQSLGPAQTLALDLSPLPLLIAARLVRGEILEGCEFPIAPRGQEEVAVNRRLRCPFPVREGLTFILADGFSPPFAPGSLDAVVTPWFIDAVDADPRVTAATVCRVLKPGGLWINFGPLRFSGPTSRLYLIEEIVDIVAASGFELCGQLREQVPYFASPESGFQRLELVYGFAARKTGEAPTLTAPQTDPDWVLDPRVPIPALPLWTSIRDSAGLAGQVLSLLDGRRSTADLADTLGQAWGVDPRTLDAELQAYLLRFLPR